MPCGLLHRRMVDDAQQVVACSGGSTGHHLDRARLELSRRAMALDEAVDHVTEARDLRGDDARLFVLPGAEDCWMPEYVERDRVRCRRWRLAVGAGAVTATPSPCLATNWLAG